ncbi:MAG: hypothetical protein JWP13_843 [Candidatus Saccharibacteria bacterium]|nr:hypothetical protein [Candidatus Saccharibacteria bacterium]
MADLQRNSLRLGGALLLSSALSLGLLIAGARSGEDSYAYMGWNLFLAWLPLAFMFWLLKILRRARWSSWEGIGVSLLWLGFLPNSFYLISDLIHIQESPQSEVLYDAVMFTSFSLNGMLLGYISLYLFHVQLRRRISSNMTRFIIGMTLFLCSFAIYLGRDLRWNTWDVFVNPAGLLFDLSNRFISPFSYPRMFITTGIFFVLLTTMYYVGWNIVRVLRYSQTSK